MKSFLVATAMFLAINTQASGVKYICKEKTDYQKSTLILTQVGDREIKEGVKEKFTLEIYDAFEKTPKVYVSGAVKTEDVMVSFKSNDKNFSFVIYLDEIHHATLTVNRTETYFNCD